MHGHWSEGRHWLQAALEKSGEQSPPKERAQALYGAGSLAWRQGDHEAARTFIQESLTIRKAIGDEQGTADSLNSLGLLAADREGRTGRRAGHGEGAGAGPRGGPVCLRRRPARARFLRLPDPEGCWEGN